MTFLGAVIGGIITYYATLKMGRIQIYRETILPFISTIKEMYRLINRYDDGEIDDYFIFYFQELYKVLIQVLFDRGGLFLILAVLEATDDDITSILQPIRAIQYEIIKNNRNPKRIPKERIIEIFKRFLNTRKQFDNIENRLIKRNKLF